MFDPWQPDSRLRKKVPGSAWAPVLMSVVLVAPTPEGWPRPSSGAFAPPPAPDWGLCPPIGRRPSDSPSPKHHPQKSLRSRAVLHAHICIIRTYSMPDPKNKRGHICKVRVWRATTSPRLCYSFSQSPCTMPVHTCTRLQKSINARISRT